MGTSSQKKTNLTRSRSIAMTSYLAKEMEENHFDSFEIETSKNTIRASTAVLLSSSLCCECVSFVRDACTTQQAGGRGKPHRNRQA